MKSLYLIMFHVVSVLELLPNIIQWKRVCSGSSSNAQTFPTPSVTSPIPLLTPKLHSLWLSYHLLCEAFSNAIMWLSPLLAGFSHWALCAPLLNLTQWHVFEFFHAPKIYSYRQQGGREYSKHVNTRRT